MAKFPSLTFTEAGMKMLIQAQAGHTLTFTKGKLGSGVLTDSDDISEFTDLKAPKMTLPIFSVDDTNKEKIVLTFNTSNTELEEGFVSREFGIFAKLDNGEETLYAYSNAGNNYDYIPSKDTPSDENRMVVNLVVSSSADIKVEINKSIVYPPLSKVEAMLKEHAESKNAHEFAGNTIVDTSVPKNDTGTIRNQLSQLANRIKEISGNGGWKDAPLTNLATMAAFLTNMETAGDVVWSGKKFTNKKLGVSGLIDQNGYIAFGPNFGGLIIQWGSFGKVVSGSVISLPISATPVVAIPIDVNTGNNSLTFSTVDYRNGSFRVYGNRFDGNTDLYGNWLAICF